MATKYWDQLLKYADRKEEWGRELLGYKKFTGNQECFNRFNKTIWWIVWNTSISLRQMRCLICILSR